MTWPTVFPESSDHAGLAKASTTKRPCGSTAGRSWKARDARPRQLPLGPGREIDKREALAGPGEHELLPRGGEDSEARSVEHAAGGRIDERRPPYDDSGRATRLDEPAARSATARTGCLSAQPHLPQRAARAGAHLEPDGSTFGRRNHGARSPEPGHLRRGAMNGIHVRPCHNDSGSAGDRRYRDVADLPERGHARAPAAVHVEHERRVVGDEQPQAVRRPAAARRSERPRLLGAAAQRHCGAATASPASHVMLSFLHRQVEPRFPAGRPSTWPRSSQPQRSSPTG